MEPRTWRDAVSTVAAAVGVALVALAVLGSLYVAAFARTGPARWNMRGVLVCLGLFIVMDGHLDEGLNMVLGMPGMFGVMVGGAYCWSDARELRRMAPAFDLAAGELHGGTVLVFRESGGDDETGDVVVGEFFVHTVEVLPLSGFIYRVNAEEPRGWEVAELTRVATPPVRPDDRWLSPEFAEVQRSAASCAYRERAMTPGELAELRALRRIRVRRLVLELFLFTWGAAVLVRVGQWIVQWRMDAELSAVGWILVGCIVAVRTIGQYRDWRLVGQDVDRGVVLRVWDRLAQTISDVPAQEFLPASGAIWTKAGEPAGWRTLS